MTGGGLEDLRRRAAAVQAVASQLGADLAGLERAAAAEAEAAVAELEARRPAEVEAALRGAG